MSSPEVSNFEVPEFHQPTDFPPQQPAMRPPIRLAQMPEVYFDPGFIDAHDVETPKPVELRPVEADLTRYDELAAERQRIALRRLSKHPHEARSPEADTDIGSVDGKPRDPHWSVMPFAKGMRRELHI